MPNEKVNKTTVIKDYLRAHPGAKNKEVADALTKSGIKMTPNYVATIKSKHRRRRKAATKVISARGVGIGEVKVALSLLKMTGGIKKANAALAAALEIRKIV
jgi:hypothetical protein